MVPTLEPLTLTVLLSEEGSLLNSLCKVNFLIKFSSIILSLLYFFSCKHPSLYLKLSFLLLRHCLNLVCFLTSGKHLSSAATICLSTAASAEECIEFIHSFTSGNGTGSPQYVQLLYHHSYIRSHYPLNLTYLNSYIIFLNFFQRQ